MYHTQKFYKNLIYSEIGLFYLSECKPIFSYVCICNSWNVW